MHHLVSMASRRVSRLLRPGLRLCPSPGAQRSAPRMLVTDNFGRRPELYDDDTFIPIDEHPASWAVRPQPQPSHVGSTIETVEATRAEEAEPREAEPTAAATATVATAAAATEHSQPAEPLPTPGGLFAGMILSPQCHFFRPLITPSETSEQLDIYLII